MEKKMNEERITTKAKINLREGLIELEGSEKFVQENLDLFKDGILNLEKPKKIQEIKSKKEQKQKGDKRGKKEVLPQTISFEVGKKENAPSLIEFFKEKGDPVMHYDVIVCIAYYIEKYSELKEFEEGHVLYAYKYLKKRLPKNFHQAFIDSKNQKMWIENGSSEKKWKLAYDGELHVENELPPKKNEK